MSNKVVFTKEFIDNVILQVNAGEDKNIIAGAMGISEKTLRRRFGEFGYRYERLSGTYVSDKVIDKDSEIKEVSATIKKDLNVMLNRTYSISAKLERALKFKALKEDKTISEIINKILEENVEEEYWRF